MALKIAVTGNIASGKSKVEEIIKKHGYSVYDTDKIAHEILDTLTDFYGYDVFTDGKIDRKKLSKLVFSHIEIKEKLEKLIHPKVKDEILKIFEKDKEQPFIFISVPLLYEAGFDSIFDKVLMVSIDENIQLKRLIQRNNYTQDEAKIRINSQKPQAEKEKQADYVIKNNSTIKDLEKQVEKFLKNIKAK